MGRTPKLGTEHEQDVQRLLDSGHSIRAIGEWLEQHHGIKVDYVAVRRFIRSLGAERAEGAKAVIRGHAAGSAASAMRVLEKRRRCITKLANEAVKNGSTRELVELAGEERKLCALLIRASGAGEADKSDGADKVSADKVLAKLDAMLGGNPVAVASVPPPVVEPTH